MDQSWSLFPLVKVMIDHSLATLFNKQINDVKGTCQMTHKWNRIITGLITVTVNLSKFLYPVP